MVYVVYTVCTYIYVRNAVRGQKRGQHKHSRSSSKLERNERTALFYAEDDLNPTECSWELAGSQDSTSHSAHTKAQASTERISRFKYYSQCDYLLMVLSFGLILLNMIYSSITKSMIPPAAASKPLPTQQ